MLFFLWKEWTNQLCMSDVVRAHLAMDLYFNKAAREFKDEPIVQVPGSE